MEFLFGLVCASVVVVAARIKKWTSQNVVAVACGTVVAYIIVGLVPVSTPDAPWFLVLCGAIAICAMILPGISGAFLLVLLGKYEFVLSAVHTRKLVPMAYIGVGAVVGIIAFSQVLGWLFKKYHDVTVALLTGLMIGSLRKIWPWKIADANVIPAWDGSAMRVLVIIGMGAALVAVIEVLAHRSR